jgi:hypothetical protein
MSALAAVGCGVAAVLTGLAESPRPFGWVAVPALLGAVAVGWRRTRWLAVLTALGVLVLSVGSQTVSTAVLTGALLVGFLVLTDLAEAIDLPDLADSVPRPDGADVRPTATDDLPGWAQSAGVLWLSGAVAAVLVGVVASRDVAPVAPLVATAPVLALAAAYLAFGRLRP